MLLFHLPQHFSTAASRHTVVFSCFEVGYWFEYIYSLYIETNLWRLPLRPLFRLSIWMEKPSLAPIADRGGSRAEQLCSGSLKTAGFGQHNYITSASRPLTAGACKSWSHDKNCSYGLKQVTNLFLRWAVGSLKWQTLSWHVLGRTAAEAGGCRGAARCCVGLIVSNKKYLQGQIVLILSWYLRNGAVETRRAARPSSTPLSFVFCLRALRILWESIWAVSGRELGRDACGKRSNRRAFIIERER